MEEQSGRETFSPIPARFLPRKSLPPCTSETQSRRLYLYAEVPQVRVQVGALPLSLGRVRSTPSFHQPGAAFTVPSQPRLHPSLRKDPAPVPCSLPRAPFLQARLRSDRLQGSDRRPATLVATPAAITETRETQGLWNRACPRPVPFIWLSDLGRIFHRFEAGSCFIKEESYL